jgi:hypothetical protein
LSDAVEKIAMRDPMGERKAHVSGAASGAVIPLRCRFHWWARQMANLLALTISWQMGGNQKAPLKPLRFLTRDYHRQRDCCCHGWTVGGANFNRFSNNECWSTSTPANRTVATNQQKNKSTIDL